MNLLDVYLISTYTAYIVAVPELLDIRTERNLSWVLRAFKHTLGNLTTTQILKENLTEFRPN